MRSIKAKKIQSIILGLILLVIPIFMLAGCGGSKIAFNDKMLENVSVNLSNVKSFGIANKNPDSTGQSDQSEKKNYLVTFDESNNIKDVIFYKENNKEMRQEEIPGQIDKLFVTKDFTYISFTSDLEHEREIRQDYDRINYRCDTNNQSFVIDNKTGKVYSLAEISNWINSILYGNIIECTGRSYYLLSVVENTLVATNLVNNPNIQIYGVGIDKYGTIFIRNDSVAEVAGNRVLYTDYNHYFGNNQTTYVMGEWLEFKMYDSNKELVPIDDNLYVTLYGSSIYVIQNECVITLGGSAIEGYIKGSNAGSLFKLVDNPVASDNQVFGFKNETQTLCYYYISKDGSSYKLNEVEIMTATTAQHIDNNLIVTAEGADGTKKYKVYIEDGVPKKELISEITYDIDVIVVQPLN